MSLLIYTNQTQDNLSCCLPPTTNKNLNHQKEKHPKTIFFISQNPTGWTIAITLACLWKINEYYCNSDAFGLWFLSKYINLHLIKTLTGPWGHLPLHGVIKNLLSSDKIKSILCKASIYEPPSLEHARTWVLLCACAGIRCSRMTRLIGSVKYGGWITSAVSKPD